MQIPVRFVVIWLATLSVLVALAWITATKTTWRWFENDVALRAELAVSGARRGLTEGLERRNVRGLAQLLDDISTDERILAASLCTPERQPLTATRGFPEALSCPRVGRQLEQVAGDDAGPAAWHAFTELKGGDVHVSVLHPASGLVSALDYTQGIEERFHAIERLLEREPQWCGRFTFLQIASPSRTLIERHGRLNAEVEALAERINARFARGDWTPIVLLRRHTEPPEVFRLYRAADVCYVGSLHDGVNLVAKEFLAARDDEQGVLVLSKFTGAARELPEALLVNPYDTDEAASALAMALRMSPEEQRTRLRAMRRLVSELNVYRWAGRMLLDASRLRRREQLAGLLGANGIQRLTDSTHSG